MLSCICLTYFGCLIFLSFKQIYISDIFRAIFELFTIPFIILVLILIVFNFRKLYLEKWSIKSKHFISILVLFVTVALISVATILNI
jgi:Ca2+/Na+ antiporter